MNKSFLSLILAVAGWAVFHYGLLPIFTPKPLGWVLNPYVYYLIFCAYLIIVNVGMRLNPPMALKAFYVFMLGHYFYDAILLPQIPWTLYVTYMMLWGIGTFLYISQDPTTFREFRAPIVKTIIGEYKLARVVVFTLLPVLVGFATYKTIYPSFAEPVELRTVHPAPPSTTKVHGKTYKLEEIGNPFRIDEQDNYKDSFPFLDADKQEYMKYVTEGGTIFLRIVITATVIN